MFYRTRPGGQRRACQFRTQASAPLRILQVSVVEPNEAFAPALEHEAPGRGFLFEGVDNVDEPVVLDPHPAPQAIPATFAAIPGLSAVAVPIWEPLSTMLKAPFAMSEVPVAVTARRIDT